MICEHEQVSMIAIEKARGLHRSLATKLAQAGVPLEDIAIAALYSAMDVVSTWKGSPVEACEWLRLGIDVQERTLLGAKETRQ